MDGYSHYMAKLIHRASKLYMVHCMADPVIGPDGHTRIVMLKYGIATGQE
jgi:hypothetical protein